MFRPHHIAAALFIAILIFTADVFGRENRRPQNFQQNQPVEFSPHAS